MGLDPITLGVLGFGFSEVADDVFDFFAPPSPEFNINFPTPEEAPAAPQPTARRIFGPSGLTRSQLESRGSLTRRLGGIPFSGLELPSE